MKHGDTHKSDRLFSVFSPTDGATPPFYQRGTIESMRELLDCFYFQTPSVVH